MDVKSIQTAAKRRKGAGNKVPCRGLGQSPNRLLMECKAMKIMFIGLGLIGGSMALALEGYPELERYAVDGD